MRIHRIKSNTNEVEKKLTSKYIEAKHELELLKHFTIIYEDSYQHVGM